MRRRVSYALAASVAALMLISPLGSRTGLFADRQVGPQPPVMAEDLIEGAGPPASVAGEGFASSAAKASLGRGASRADAGLAASQEDPRLGMAAAELAVAVEAEPTAPKLQLALQTAPSAPLAAPEPEAAAPALQIPASDPSPASGQPLLLVSRQPDPLGPAGDGRANSALAGISSGNPQRMLSGIAGAPH